MNQNFDTICRHFESENFSFETVTDRHLIIAQLGLKHTTVHLMVHAPPDEGLLTFIFRLPVMAPEARRAAVGEFLHRVNQVTRTGAFNLDYDDGEIQFVIGVHLPEDVTLLEETLQRWLLFGGVTVDGFTPPLMQVAFGNLAPATAMEQSEAFLQDFLRQLGQSED